MKTKARVIAFYLPQFHPIPENDFWWGKGFTEWTNVGKAKPLFKGHYQPRVPADLGYYDLRIAEIREEQAKLAAEAGIEGFMYWHYWFGNDKIVLDMPYKELLKTKKPDFPFCLGWANHTWANKTWISSKTGKSGNDVIFQQTYPGKEDYIKHFEYCLAAFKDPRYIKVHNKPLFYIYNPLEITDWDLFYETWNELAIKNGLDGIHFVGSNKENLNNISKVMKMKGISAVTSSCFDNVKISLSNIFRFKFFAILHNKFNKDIALQKFSYKKAIKYLTPKESEITNIYPVLIPQYDDTARRNKRATILVDSTPSLFREHLRKVLNIISNKEYEDKIVLLRSWNEWAEGNYIEPDLKYGKGYLDVLKEELIIK